MYNVEIKMLAKALQKRSRSFRVKREIISKIEENAERKFIEFLPSLSTV